MRATGNIAGVQWGKLLVNLNNALSALSGLPLRQQLAQRAWRSLFADQMAEGLMAIRAEGIRPVSSTPVPANWTPHLLRLPDAVFAALLGGTMKIDPEARSSMWEDSIARPPHRNRLSAGRHRRNRRPAWIAGSAHAPRHGAGQARRGGWQGLAGVDAGTGPARATALKKAPIASATPGMHRRTVRAKLPVLLCLLALIFSPGLIRRLCRCDRRLSPRAWFAGGAFRRPSCGGRVDAGACGGGKRQGQPLRGRQFCHKIGAAAQSKSG